MEDEEEVFSHRAKLFRFARECTPPEWKERGLGDIKIMENNNTKVNNKGIIQNTIIAITMTNC